MLVALTCGALVGCQDLGTSTFVMLQPPSLPVDMDAVESVPTLGPGKPASAPSRLAQPTVSPLPGQTPTSAAPGFSEVRKAPLARTLLLKATAALEAGELAGAARLLNEYLQHFPDSAMIRLQLAEILFRQSRHESARLHFLQALGEVVDPELPVHCRLHAHSRLMEIASVEGDRYNEDLQRGIGLLVLAQHRQTVASSESEVTVQELLGKARAALSRASRLAPGDARPALYLAAVWQVMGQHANALHSLRQAQAMSLNSRLTSQEWLQLALWNLEWQAK